MENISQILKNELLSRGASLVGFADLSELPLAQRNEFRYGIVIAVALDPAIINGIADGPTQEYFAEYNRANGELDRLVTYAGSLLNERGHETIEKTTAQVVVDDHSLTSILPHKTVATRAGLGWIGKCALLVTEQYGSAIRISSLLTNAPLDTGTPINTSRCGDCLICTQSCPTGAPLGENWTIAKPREDFSTHLLAEHTLRLEQLRPELTGRSAESVSMSARGLKGICNSMDWYNAKVSHQRVWPSRIGIDRSYIEIDCYEQIDGIRSVTLQ